MEVFDVRPIIKAYKNGMPLEMVAKNFDMSLHKVIEILYLYSTKDK